jgi:hypothetical protein
LLFNQDPIVVHHPAGISYQIGVKIPTPLQSPLTMEVEAYRPDNQVESWFSKIQGRVIDRGIFTLVRDLRRDLIRDRRTYAKVAKSIRLSYRNVNHRIRTNVISGTAQ